MKNSIKSLTLCLLTSLAYGGISFGSEKDTAAKSLMQTMKVEEQLAPSFEAVRSMQNSILDSQQLSDEDRKMVEQMMATAQDEIADAMSWDALEPLMLRAYGQVFTVGELKQLNSLFQRDAGRVYIDKQAELQAALMGTISGIMNELMPKIQANTVKAVEQLKKEQR